MHYDYMISVEEDNPKTLSKYRKRDDYSSTRWSCGTFKCEIVVTSRSYQQPHQVSEVHNLSLMEKNT